MTQQSSSLHKLLQPIVLGGIWFRCLNPRSKPNSGCPLNYQDFSLFWKTICDLTDCRAAFWIH